MRFPDRVRAATTSSSDASVSPVASRTLDSPKDAPLNVAAKLAELHQLLYGRGGIRPSNAAIEELTKLVLLQVIRARDPDWVVDGRRISEVLDPASVRSSGIEPVKRAFVEAIRRQDIAGRLPDGSDQPIWPLDEPLRIEGPDVLAAALEVASEAVPETASEYALDLVGTAFDVLLRGRYDHAGGLATYLTPHAVAELAARISFEDLDFPRAATGPLVGDPCCGTGRFLLAALTQARTLLQGRFDPHTFAFGADQSPSSVAKARVNLLLHGVDRPMVFAVADSVTSPAIDRLRGTLPLILTNPPFGDGKYDCPEGVRRTLEGLDGLARSRTRIDPALAFLSRCLELLSPGGRLAIVLPDGLVDGPVVRGLMRDDQFRLLPREVSVEGRVSLPTATFALAGTVARTSIVFLRRGAPRHGRVFLARADHVGYLKQAGGAAADPNGDDLPLITEFVLSAGSAVPPQSGAGYQVLSERPLVAIANASSISTLEPSSADVLVTESRKALARTGAKKLGDLLEVTSAGRTQPGRGRSSEVPFLSVLHVDERGGVDWHAAERYFPTTPGKVAASGSVLVSLLNPSKLRAAVVPDQYDFVYCSAEFGVYRALTADPHEALVLLYHPHVRAQLKPLGRGTSSSRRRINETELLDVLVPDMSQEELTERSTRAREADAAYNRALHKLARALDDWSSNDRVREA